MRILSALSALVLFGSHAALAPAGGPLLYTATELVGLSNGNNFVYAISDPVSNGAAGVGPVIVGESFNQFTTPSLSWRPVVWRPAVAPICADIMPVAIAGNSSINRAGDVSPDGTRICGYSNGGGARGRRWTYNPATGVAGNPETLTSGTNATEAAGINSAGRAAGWAINGIGNFVPVTWPPDSAAGTTLTLPAGSDQYQIPREISEAPNEFIVGRSDRASPTVATRGIIWKHSTGSAYGTGTLLALLGGTANDCFGISPDGMIACGTSNNGTQFNEGARWAAEDSPPTVGSFGQFNGLSSFVMDVNNAGVGVGFYVINFQISRAALFIDGVAYDLGSRVTDLPGVNESVFLRIAYGINSAGQIVGHFGTDGLYDSPGRAYLLTPIVEPPACALLGDLNQDESVNGADIGGYVRAKLGEPPAPGEEPACADFGNNDIGLDTIAFVAVLLQ